MSISCAPRHACESGETPSAARCQVTGLPQTINIPEAGSGPTRPLNCRARSNRSATGQGLHLPAWRMQFCIYLSTSKIRNKNSYISWGAAKGFHPYMGGRPQAASLVQGLRPRNAPLQNHPSPTVFTLPQHRVWRTVSPPPILSHPPNRWPPAPAPNPCSSPAVPPQFPSKKSLTDRTSSYRRCAPTNMAANRIPIQIACLAAAKKGWSR